jgi:hypothetical protein
MAYIKPLNGETPFIVDRKTCFIRRNTDDEYFLEFQRKNRIYMYNNYMCYHHSPEHKELYVLIPENIAISCFFASDFDISTYISVTQLSVISQPNVAPQIKHIIDKQLRFFRIDVRDGDFSTTNGKNLDEICISTFFSEKTHDEFMMKIRKHVDFNTVNMNSQTVEEIGHKMKGIHEKFDDFRRTSCKKFQPRHITSFNNSRNVLRKLSHTTYGVPRVLENDTQTVYEMPNVDSNIEFVYRNGLLTVTNGIERGNYGERDEIAEYIAKMFENHANYQNKKRKMYDDY